MEAPELPASPSSSDTSSAAVTSPLSSVGPISLQPPQARKSPKNKKRSKFFRRLLAVTRAFPIISPAMCKMPAMGGGAVTGTRVTGTLFGRRRARVSLAIQESPGRLPVLVMELAVQTGRIFGEFQTGLVRIALECERHAPPGERREIAEEPVWAMYSNGKRAGYGVRREATEEDLSLMQALRATTMGVGVVPIDPPEPPEGDLVYMRATFERVVGSKDSETYYMVSPDDTTGPEVTIFFVRL